MNEILLNMIPNSCAPEVHLSQYDNGRVLRFVLKEGNAEYQAPSGAVVKVKATKPSGLGFIVSGTISDGNIVTVTNTETMTNEAGRFPAELSITSGSILLGTSNFVFNIERSPHPEGTIDGDAETLLPELTLLVERIEDSNARIESMTASATPVPSGQNPTANYNETTNTLELGIPVADRQYITVDEVDYAITSITKTVVDEVSGLLVAYGTDSTVFIPDGVGVKNVAQILQAQINGKVSAVKLNGDILTPHYDSSFGDGVVDLGTISDDTKADAIVKTASGSIASFSDGGDNMPMKSLKVNIVPKQSGTGDASPTNKRPISGWDTVNAFVRNSNLFSVSESVWGEIIASSNGAFASNSSAWRSGYIPAKPDTEYKLSGLENAVYSLVAYYDINKNYITRSSGSLRSDITFTTPADCYYIAFTQYGTSETPAPTDKRNEIRLCFTKDNSLPYEPYQGTSKSISLGQTVYGGTLDVVSGKLVIDRFGYVFNGTETIWSGDQSGHTRYTVVNVLAEGPAYTRGQWCSHFAPNTAPIGANNYNNVITGYTPVKHLFIRADAYATADDLKAYILQQYQNGTPVTYVSYLQTPTEIQLTPTEVKTLLGSNNIWADAGTVEVEYRADTTLVYNELLSLIASLS